MTPAAHIALRNVSVRFPVLSFRDRSLRSRFVNAMTLRRTTATPHIVSALNDVNLDIRAGDRVAIIGANGAGKTTLLRVLAGIYHPTSGSVDVLGRCLPLFDLSAGFDVEATGYENIMRRGLVIGARRSEIDAKRGEIAAFTELGDRLDLPLRTYSSGMMLRLIFAVATAVVGEIVLLDEWIGVGDQQFREKARQRLDEIVVRAGILVLASHDIELIKSTCNRAILLEEGRIVAAGATDEILGQYLGGGKA
ncbi:ABC transporter ATP-binding protein [Bradyrhizobium sp. 193]|uniref:ABC transporter ATP-binding protein n=1 Tax=unclassified Bradyrhizobium TaxID=2631580 RepID=UPI001FF86893|nr:MULTISPECIES: ABC transporter ATP-binding protein [unclassified Bradyrhizobium]MCK1343052.1 ABC transporter ATP-binding protein [Bradyrhizobium sp. CW11]MCK1467861.1 ABC transporter ATP-binding protein [Bradyrhizobium sp. CW10]MCK1484995.1 ABC transporter ATP-binding protein [Bradyrhizobium sp. 193]MCK1582781.1 ABC transporter ATP-binding protein [Bradyrhizobium sp. 168]MCK1586404.1 ABC transporter ATP-binding protein [Bradyrhizobium sp. 169]